MSARLEREFRLATFFARVENLLDAEHDTFGVLALNRLTDPAAPRVEPFLTPGFSRRFTAGLRVRLW